MRSIVFLLGVILFSSCYHIERNCNDYKTGTYYSEVEINNVLYKSFFERTIALQIEKYEGKIDSSKVRWINDCEVVFKTINPKSMSEKKDIHLKILSTTDSSYIFEYSYVGEKIKQKGVAYKVN